MSLLKQSENWGVVAPAFGIVASLLTLPPWPVRSKIEATPCVLTAIPEGNIWIEYFGQCVFRAGIVLFGTFGLAVMIPFAEQISCTNFSGNLRSRKIRCSTNMDDFPV